MAKPRKRHKQQELFRHGGKRAGAGRPKQRARASEHHKKRPALKPYEPIHVVLRATPEVGSLRRRDLYRAVRRALLATIGRESCRIVHISLQGSHIHLIVEADNRIALARGMQAFQISAAKHINAALSKRGTSRPGARTPAAPHARHSSDPHRSSTKRRGPVFSDRYHARIIRSPRQAHHSLAYVLNNWRHHGEHRDAIARTWRIDPFSSGPSFDGWRDLDASTLEWPVTYEPLPVWQPKTWLLREGWRKQGLIDPAFVPGRKSAPIAAVLAE